MILSEKGFDLIKKHEGLCLTAYVCPAGVLTIGYGHTSGVKVGMQITGAIADAFLRLDVRSAEDAVNRNVSVQLKQNQFDALVSFTFNLGEGKLKASTLLKRVNEGNYLVAADEFRRWNMGRDNHGVLIVLPGLVSRRADESALFRG